MRSNLGPHSQPRREFLQGALLGAATCSLSPPISLAEEGARIVDRDLAAAMEKAELSMLFRGTTADQCHLWQDQFRAKLIELLGDSTPPPKWTILQESQDEFDSYTQLELLLKADDVPALPVYLLVPKGLQRGQRVPGVLCVHGHGPLGNDAIVGCRDADRAAEHIDPLNYDYGAEFARRGYVVVAPCMIPFGRRVDRDRYGGKDPCAVTFVRMQALGQLPITANLRDLRWSIDLLQSRQEVNGEAIGCAGLSYGGRMTMMVSAIDQRVRVASVSGALNLLQERMTLRHSCGSQMIPGLLKYGDYSEIGSLIAPRPCVWETGSTDSLIVANWDDVFRDRLRRVYKALGAADRLHFDRFEGGHQWSGKIAYPLFDEVLKT
jgi:dienelactone hydrolase